ncbi:MAG: PEPxxWA-CTERM sorting domain-containing protein [Pseudomonadota bacterium]
MRVSVAGLALAAGIGMAGGASAATVTPVSYTFDAAADCGSWCYYDTSPTRTRLTDGVLGTAGWAVNQGANWVGWTDSVINIDFTFDGPSAFRRVSVGSTQDNLSDVVLPDLFVYSSLNGVDWTLRGARITDPEAANNRDPNSTAPHVFLDVGVDFTAPYVRLQVQRNGPFSFIDEVRFDDTAAVPEPGAWALMIAGFGLAGSALRRRARLTVA